MQFWEKVACKGHSLMLRYNKQKQFRKFLHNIKRIKWEVTANVADEKIMPENGLEVRYERYKGIIKNFTLMSDIFMRNVFKQKECLEYVLQVIMEKQDLQVIDQIIQKDYKNLQERSAIQYTRSSSFAVFRI